MSLTTRSAMLQMRVTPAIKYASEQVLRRIGLSMTEAMELFLRRVIVDEKLPFEVVALDQATLARLLEEVRSIEREQQTAAPPQRRTPSNRREGRRRGG